MTHDAPLCAKCGRPLPIVMQRLYQGGPWTEVENSVEAEDGSGDVCGWPGCEPQEPSELRKALRGLLNTADRSLELTKPQFEAYRAAADALAGDER